MAYQFPRNEELRAIEQTLLPRLTEGRPIFSILPMRPVRASLLRWAQKDNYKGLMGLRGLGGPPNVVRPVAEKEYIAEPGYYGDVYPINEREMTVRRALGDKTGTPIDVTDLVMERKEFALQRRLDLIETIGWTLIATGTFTQTGVTGITHTDTFSVQTHAASDWSTVATATPIADFRAAQLLGRGSSNIFDRGSVAYMNRVTANYLLANSNAADLSGKRVEGGNSINDFGAINRIMLAQDLPMIEIMDDGYLNTSGTFVPFIATDKVVIVGRRANGAPLGYFGMTYNANNPDGGPGPYSFVVDKTRDQVPPLIEYHDGFNGGPVLEYPGGIIAMSV